MGLDRRFNYRHFQQDNIPSKELINEILQRTIDVVPIKNEGWHFKLEAWGPEHYDEKRELAIITIAKREHMFGVFDGDEEEWYENAKKLYEYEEENDLKPKDRNTSYFNNQVRAPYLISLILSPEKWNPKNEPCNNQEESFMAGMFAYGISVVANNLKVDCAFCSCFEKGLKNHFNYITTKYDKGLQGESDCLALIGLGYYNFLGKKKIYTGSIYDTEKRIKIGNKDTKPKLENVIEWK